MYGLMLAIAAALHPPSASSNPRLVYSVALTVFALLALAPYYNPHGRGVFSLTLFFIIELDE